MLRFGFLILLIVMTGCSAAFSQGRADSSNTVNLRERVEAYRLLRLAWQNHTQSHASAIEQFDPVDPYGLELSESHQSIHQEAIRLSVAALELNPSLPDAHLIIANSSWDLGETARAEEHYTRLLEIDPARDDVLSARVGLRVSLKDWVGAEADVARLAELGSEFAESSRRELDRAIVKH